jgi:hypothetical protein
MRRIACGHLLACAAAVLMAACGSPTPVTPTPNPGGGVNGGSGNGGATPPANNLPVIDSITIQGTRPRQPASFADAAEIIPVSAKVRDDETAVDQLVYTWTATAGTISGTGANVTWTAPASVPAPVDVTITLTLIEKYGHVGGPLSFEQTVSKTAGLSLHDSIREVGTISRQFLLDFSDTNIKDASYIMRNFGGAGTCPDPHEVQLERDDVINNFTNYRMLNFLIDQPLVRVNFGGTCASGKRGDACAVVPVFWDSVDLRTNTRQPTAGEDTVAAAYSAKDSRWWLCASSYSGRNLITGARVNR